MSQMTKQTETLKTEPTSQSAKRIVGTLFGIIEILLVFRLGFKGLGANPENGFVNGIYTITNYIVGIFEGIFSSFNTNGAETTAILEPATVIAMVVVGIIAWLVMKLMTPRTSNKVERTTEYSEQNNSEK